jgi:DNA-binding NarL/FixJ family response regulator
MKLNKLKNKDKYMRLSPKKVEILTLIAQGYTDKEIANSLKMSIRTVQTHISSIISKLNARNRVNAVVLYMQHNPNWNV